MWQEALKVDEEALDDDGKVSNGDGETFECDGEALEGDTEGLNDLLLHTTFYKYIYHKIHSHGFQKSM